MLNIWYGEPGDRILTNPNRWFKYNGKKYLGTDFSKNLIENIDKCKYISDNVVDSKYLGVINSEKISSSSKTIMCMMYEDMKMISYAFIGDNLIPYLRYVSDRKEVFLISAIPVGIYSIQFSQYNGKVRILNNGNIISNGIEMYEEFERICNEDYRVYDVLERSVLDDWRSKLGSNNS